MKTFKTILFLLILSSVCTVLLAGGQYLYNHLSSRFNVELYATILEMFEFEVAKVEIEDRFHEKFDTVTVGTSEYYICKGAPSPGAIVFKHDGSGLWSNIEILLAIKENREEIYKLRILSQAED